MAQCSSASPSTTRIVRGLAIPGGLVHAHIHLDKCFLLDKTPIQNGSFQEAMVQTDKAKASFSVHDIVERGRKLIQQSMRFGVQAMRCHVEVDPTVGLKCVHAGKQLQREFEQLCDIQLVAFAQDPIMHPDDTLMQRKMIELLVEACQDKAVAAVGSAPYVESKLHETDADNTEAQRLNIDIIFDLATRWKKHVDFHLDYNLDKSATPMLWYVLEGAQKRAWSSGLVIGHATRLSLFKQDELARLQRLCQDVPQAAFVALPTSDLYMQGRETAYGERQRATMPLLELARRDITTALSVNNVSNLFTPQGDGDPLSLLPLAVALWQSAKPKDLADILAMVSHSARRAIGLPLDSQDHQARAIEVEVDENSRDVRCLSTDDCGTSYTLLTNCESIQDAVLAPHAARLTVRNGRIVAWRHVDEGDVSQQEHG